MIRSHPISDQFDVRFLPERGTYGRVEKVFPGDDAGLPGLPHRRRPGATGLGSGRAAHCGAY